MVSGRKPNIQNWRTHKPWLASSVVWCIQGKSQRPHVATEPWNHGLFQGNHPQMAELFRLVKYCNLPRWDYDPWNCLGVSDMVRYGLLCTFQFRDSDSNNPNNGWSQKLYNWSDCNWGDGVEIANWKWFVLHNCGLDHQRCLRDENHAAITVAAVVKSPKKSW